MIRLSAFGGANYYAEPHLLDESAAQEAVNCRIGGGAIEPLRGMAPGLASVVPGARSVYRFPTGEVLSWAADVDVVSGPVPGDTEGRTYYTGDGKPKMTTFAFATAGSDPTYWPTNSYDLGVPAPYSGLYATVEGEADDWSDPPEYWVYTYTYVTFYGEEGPPADPSNIVTTRPGHTISLSGIDSPPAGARNIKWVRIYRSKSAAGDTEYLFLKEIAAGDTDTTDDIPTDQINPKPLPSMTWDPPPSDMVGLVSMPNGVLAGFSGNDLYFSEPYRPHAWPVGYRLTMNHPIVGIVPIQGGLVVATEATPYIVSAAHPSAASMQEIEQPLGCVSKAGMVDMGEHALYPTADALVAVGPQGVTRVTDFIMGEEVWRSLSPETIKAFRWDGRYVAFYDGGGFMLDPNGGGLTFLEDSHIDGGWADPLNGDLYLLRDGHILHWGYGDKMTCRWRSKDYLAPRYPSMSAARVDAESYPVTLRVFGDGETVSARTVEGPGLHRLNTPRARRWAVEVESDATVYTVSVAESAGGAV